MRQEGPTSGGLMCGLFSWRIDVHRSMRYFALKQKKALVEQVSRQSLNLTNITNFWYLNLSLFALSGEILREKFFNNRGT
jgi:hypothetical protein